VTTTALAARVALGFLCPAFLARLLRLRLTAAERVSLAVVAVASLVLVVLWVRAKTVVVAVTVLRVAQTVVVAVVVTLGLARRVVRAVPALSTSVTGSADGSLRED
jgi:hypothetical protein